MSLRPRPQRHTSYRLAAALVAATTVGAGLGMTPSAQAAPNPAFALFVVNSTTHTVDQVATDGTIHTVVSGLPTTGKTPLTQDQQGNLYVGENSQVIKVAADGTQSTAASGFSGVTGLTVDPSGGLYVLDNQGPLQGSTIDKVTSGGAVTQFAASQLLNKISAIDIDPTGTLFAGNVLGVIQKYAPTNGVPDPTQVSTLPTSALGALGGITGLDATTGKVLVTGLASGLTGVAKAIDPSTGAMQLDLGSLAGTLTSPSGISVDPLGNTYLSQAGSLLQFPAVGGAPLTLSDLLNVSNVLSSVTNQILPGNPGTTNPGTTNPTPPATAPAGHGAARFRVTVTRKHQGKRHARVRASGLASGEAYVVRFGSRVVARGVATTTGSLSKRIKLPRCLKSRTLIRVTGDNGARTGAVKLRVPRRLTGCHR